MLSRRASRAARARSGAAAAEMAMVVPFLVFLFAVAADYCRVHVAAQIVNNAARCGALYASGTALPPSGQSPQQAAQQAVLAETVSLSPPLTAANVTVTIGTANATVAVTYPFQTVCPYLGLPPVINVDASVTMPLAAGTP